MKTSRALLIATAGLLLLALPGIGRAETETLTAPYSTSGENGFCSHWDVLESCAYVGDPQPETGALNADVTLVAPDAGTKPGRGASNVSASIDARDDGIPHTWRGVTYTVFLHIDRAELSRTGMLFGSDKPFTGEGDISAMITARPQTCPECNATATVPLLDEMKRQSLRTNLDLQIPVTLRNCTEDLGPPTGLVWVQTVVFINQQIGFGRTGIFADSGGFHDELPLADTGTATGSIRATVSKITAEDTDPIECNPEPPPPGGP